MEDLLRRGVHVCAGVRVCVYLNVPLTLTLTLTPGADVNLADRGGFTPLLLAAWSGNLQLAVTFLKHGADPLVRPWHTRTRTLKLAHTSLQARTYGGTCMPSLSASVFPSYQRWYQKPRMHMHVYTHACAHRRTHTRTHTHGCAR